MQGNFRTEGRPCVVSRVAPKRKEPGMRRFLMILVLVLPVSGCVPSINPIYTDKDIERMPELLGKWQTDDAMETWEFSEDDGNGYEAVYTDDKGSKYTFSIHLTRIGGVLFADLYPVGWAFEGSETVNDLFLLHVTPVHHFARLDITEGRIRARGMDPNWVRKYVEKHPFAPRHEYRDDSVLLTAPTKKLRRFIARHVAEEEVFSEDIEVVLVRPPASPPTPEAEAGDMELQSDQG